MTDHLTCPACEGRIRERADDIALTCRDTGEKYFFHADRGGCEEEAYAVFFILGGLEYGWKINERPYLWDSMVAEAYRGDTGAYRNESDSGDCGG